MEVGVDSRPTEPHLKAIVLGFGYIDITNLFIDLSPFCPYRFSGCFARGWKRKWNSAVCLLDLFTQAPGLLRWRSSANCCCRWFTPAIFSSTHPCRLPAGKRPVGQHPRKTGMVTGTMPPPARSAEACRGVSPPRSPIVILAVASPAAGILSHPSPADRPPCFVPDNAQPRGPPPA